MVYVQVTNGFNAPLKQNHLENVIKSLFPDHRVIRNARKLGQVVSPYTNRNLELDFWIVGLKLAFEYQDPYHFGSTSSINSVHERDVSKKAIVEDRGDTLIIVPCWWDGSPESLAATIRAKRPDLLLQHLNSITTIPIVPPFDYIADIAKIPNIGPLSIPSQFQLSNFNSVNWWLHEKYGGIRICWDPRHRKLYFKNGKEATSYFPTILDQLPNEIIDGEIWFGKNNSLGTTSSKMNIPIGPVECKTLEHMKDFTQFIMNGGGIGITLRRVNSDYIYGQSPSLVELSEHPTNEALVVDVLSANNVLLQSKNGDLDGVFSAKINSQVDKLPSVGEIVIYSCSKRRNAQGLPVDARISKIGENDNQNINIVPDMEEENSRKPYGYWTSEGDNNNGKLFLDSLASKKGLDPSDPESWYNITQKEIVTEGGGPLLAHYKSISRMMMSVYPDINLQPNRFRARFWSSKENRRVFFENFAHNKSFDPLVAKNWYTVSTEQILSKGGKAVIYWYNNSVSRALLDLFPEIGLQLSLFDRAQANYWKDRDNRRLFFDNFAKKHNFDPLIAKNWYPYSFKNIAEEKGGHGLLEHFNNSISRALSDCYQFTMDPTEFNNVPRYHWKNEQNRRIFFEKFASKRGLDHLNPRHWYSISQNNIIATKNGISVLNYHQGSFKTAIMELFPHIGIDVSKFELNPKGYWNHPENRKLFFEEFARSKNLDPLVASTWYKFSTQDIKNTKEGEMVLKACNHSLKIALRESFPDIGL